MLMPMVVHTDLRCLPDLPQVCISLMQLVGYLFLIVGHTHPEVMQSVVYLAHFCT